MILVLILVLKAPPAAAPTWYVPGPHDCCQCDAICAPFEGGVECAGCPAIPNAACLPGTWQCATYTPAAPTPRHNVTPPPQ
jgi:hypothetical protein